MAEMYECGGERKSTRAEQDRMIETQGVGCRFSGEQSSTAHGQEMSRAWHYAKQSGACYSAARSA